MCNNLLQRRITTTYQTRTQHTGLCCSFICFYKNTFYIPSLLPDSLKFNHAFIFCCSFSLTVFIAFCVSSFYIKPSHLTFSVSDLYYPSPSFCIAFLPNHYVPFALPSSFAHSHPPSLYCDDWDAGRRRGECWVKQRRTTRPTQLPPGMCVCVCVCVHVCLYLCIIVCVCVSLWQSKTENESDKETETDTESKVVRHWYNYTYCTWLKMQHSLC